MQFRDRRDSSLLSALPKLRVGPPGSLMWPLRNCQVETTPRVITATWSYNMEGHAKECLEIFCELANKTTQQWYRVSTPCLDDDQFKEEELASVGELSTNCDEMCVLGTQRWTRHTVVGKQTCSSWLVLSCQSLLRGVRCFSHDTCSCEVFAP